jgi:glycopeptide antibiotics resistance protein
VFKSLAENFTVAGFSQLVINLLMMIPVSFMLMIILKVPNRTLWVFDITVALVLFIELLQFFTRAGTLQLDDIITNTIGAIIGILLYYFIKAIYKKKKE